MSPAERVHPRPHPCPGERHLALAEEEEPLSVDPPLGPDLLSPGRLPLPDLSDHPRSPFPRVLPGPGEVRGVRGGDLGPAGDGQPLGDGLQEPFQPATVSSYKPLVIGLISVGENKLS